MNLRLDFGCGDIFERKGLTDEQLGYEIRHFLQNYILAIGILPKYGDGQINGAAVAKDEEDICTRQKGAKQ